MLPSMAEETGKGAWVLRMTIGDGGESRWEKCWDPEAAPLGDVEERVRYERLLELLFKPRPGDAPR